jgi:hypothetical protein
MINAWFSKTVDKSSVTLSPFKGKLHYFWRRMSLMTWDNAVLLMKAREIYNGIMGAWYLYIS